jgi:excisionase family DNA binding protein
VVRPLPSSRCGKITTVRIFAFILRMQNIFDSVKITLVLCKNYIVKINKRRIKMATEKIYTLDDIAKELFVTKRTIYNYIRDKKIKCTKIGKLWVVSESELNYIKENGLRN